VVPRLLAVLTVALLAAPPLARAGEVLDAIHARGTLRVGMTGDYKPFDFRDPGGHYRGADVEMAQHLAQYLGVKLEIVPTAWPHLAQDYKAGAFDVAMGGISILPTRQALGPFTPPLRLDGKRPIARCADKERFTTIDAIDQPGVRVIVNPGASNEAFAHEHFPHAQLTVHPDNATVFDEILAGRADVMVTDGIEVDHQALIHPELCAADVPVPFTQIRQGYWVQPDPELLAAVDTWLGEERTSGDWDRLLAAAQREP
jgi:cyclohexadienyl dehydratase